jgi:hypothetical protein
MIRKIHNEARQQEYRESYCGDNIIHTPVRAIASKDKDTCSLTLSKQ